MKERSVSSPDDLLSALEDGARAVRVVGTLQGMPSVQLTPGCRLIGGRLVFSAKGLVLTQDNTVEDVQIDCPAHEIAIGNLTTVEDLGTLALCSVRTKGQVLLVAAEAVRRGQVSIDGLVVNEADLRGRETRPHGYEVDVLQGALTVWNRQHDPEVVIRLEARGVSVGSAASPVRGSGVFVGGHSDDKGRPTGGVLEVTILETEEIVTDGGIPPGTPDLISGGVFVQAGAQVESVVNGGPVTTHGANDMALDNWGQVERWTCVAPVTTMGPSGIGFVNFGDLAHLDVQASIETFGAGARGFNLYGGSLGEAAFDSISTRGDGAVGIQVTQPLPHLEVRRDVMTSGGRGMSLVRGKQVQLEAIALSVKPGGHLGRLRVGGDVKTSGDNVVSLELLGRADHLEVGGRVVADGQDSHAAHVTDETSSALEGIALAAPHGQPLVRIDNAP